MLIKGVTSTKDLVPVQVDSFGRLVPATSEAQNMGWYGGAWHKQPVTIGYSENLDAVISAALSSATERVYGTTVPAGEVWVVTQICLSCTHAATFIDMRKYIDLGFLGVVYRVSGAVANGFYDRTLNLILPPGQRLAVHVEGSTIGANINVWYSGYKFVVNQ